MHDCSKARPRRTIDTWELQVDYGQGYETVCTEATYRAAVAQWSCYRRNAPEYPARVVLRREPITAHWQVEQLFAHDAHRNPLASTTAPEGSSTPPSHDE